MEVYYLTTPTECNIYELKINTQKVNTCHQFLGYVLFDESQKDRFEKLISDIRTAMKLYFIGRDNCKDPGNYYYLTIPDKSDIKNIKVTSSRIEQYNSTYRYNYFCSEDEANGLLDIIKEIFRRYGIQLDA